MSEEQKQDQPIQPDEVVSAALTPIGEGRSLVSSREMMLVAAEQPRDIIHVRDEVIHTLEIYPAFAQDAWYVKPVGKDYDTQKMTYAEGLSIRAAEELAQAWGNCAFSFEIIEDTEEYTDCMALFIDYERRLHFRLPIRVSKFYTKKGGGKVRHKADRFADLVMGSARSRGLREVILRCLPASLKMAYTEAIKKALANTIDDANVTKIIVAFSSIGVTRPQIEKLMEKNVAAFDGEDRGRLVGIYSAIRSGETTIEEAFGEQPPASDKGNGAPKAKTAKEKAKEQDKKAEAPQEAAAPDVPEQQVEQPTPEPAPEPKPEPEKPEEPATMPTFPDHWTATHNYVRCIAANSKEKYDAVVTRINSKKLGLSPSTGIKEYEKDEVVSATVALVTECEAKGYDVAPFKPGGPDYEELKLEG